MTAPTSPPTPAPASAPDHVGDVNEMIVAPDLGGAVGAAKAARDAVSDLGHAVWDRGCRSCAFASNALDRAADAIDAIVTDHARLTAEVAALKERVAGAVWLIDEYFLDDDYDANGALRRVSARLSAHAEERGA